MVRTIVPVDPVSKERCQRVFDDFKEFWTNANGSEEDVDAVAVETTAGSKFAALYREFLPTEEEVEDGASTSGEDGGSSSSSSEEDDDGPFGSDSIGGGAGDVTPESLAAAAAVAAQFEGRTVGPGDDDAALYEKFSAVVQSALAAKATKE